MDLEKIITKLKNYTPLYEEIELVEGYAMINTDEVECSPQYGIMLRKLIEIILLAFVKSGVLPETNTVYDLEITYSECVKRNLLYDNPVISEVFLAVLNQTGWILCTELCKDDATFKNDLPEVFENEVIKECAKQSCIETEEDYLYEFYSYYDVLTFKNAKVQQVESMIQQNLLTEDEVSVFRHLLTECMQFVEPAAYSSIWNHNNTTFYVVATFKVLNDYCESLEMDCKRNLNVFNLLSYYKLNDFINNIFNTNKTVI